MRLAGAAVAVLLAAASLEAQETASRGALTAVLEGHVADSLSGRPLPGVLVRVDTGAETLSDDGGRFRLGGLPPGPHVVALLTSDCRVAWREVELAPDEVTVLEVELVAPTSARAGDARRAEHRRAAGSLVTASDIDAMAARSLVEVIRRVEPGIWARGRTTLMEDVPEFVLVVDGVRVPDVERTLDFVQPSDVQTMELLPGPAAAWAYGSAGASGVVRIETRRGGVPAADTSEGCVVPAFPRGPGP